ncbi:conjugative transfer protein MobI(A/C) [Pseudomonas saliphila]|uniref:conjugative transfer protein MobI(A/C) n=1 Tax=Pseudomonas saliphila TaxID=2586906 RepID=UPI00123A3581|nr:conjugative transfer protein MobI(A/C) [Pseudomonas saliphila]
MLELDMELETYEEMLTVLDRQFEELTAEAKRLMVQFLEIATERNKLLPIVITINEDKRYRSTAIRWSKTVPVRSEGGSKRVLARPIRKGRGTHKYSTSAFAFLEPKLRYQVLLYEECLAIIRYALSRNCIVHSHINHTMKSLTKQLSYLES